MAEVIKQIVTLSVELVGNEELVSKDSNFAELLLRCLPEYITNEQGQKVSLMVIEAMAQRPFKEKIH